MQLHEVITKNPETIRPDDSIRNATKIMRDYQIGFLPVIDDGKVLGVLTDRDIIIRAIASGYDPQTTCVRHVMTMNPIQLRETDPLESALEAMSLNSIARLVIIDQEGNLVGVLTSGDAALACDGDNRAGKLRVAIHRRTNRELTPPPPGAQFVSD